jgi:hypothetical protein
MVLACMQVFIGALQVLVLDLLDPGFDIVIVLLDDLQLPACPVKATLICFANSDMLPACDRSCYDYIFRTYVLSSVINL